jgi:predicted thioesterase
MADVAVDELNRMDDIFAGNRLLATFDSTARELIEPFGDVVELQTGEIVLNRGDQVLSTLLPVQPTTISMTVELAGGRTVETALIGCRGAVGGIISCGHAPAFTKAIVLVGGPALRLPMGALENAKRESAFISNLFCRYSDYLLSQAMQSVACNAFHTIEQRAARWLLHAQDRAGDRIALTQEAFAGLLGVQRTTVNAVVQSFQTDAIVATGRGVVRVIDRSKLEKKSCECYRRLEDHYKAVIGTNGHGTR